MRILVTNDDGIESEGIKTLADALSEKGHIVTVVAPDGNRSAFSHSLSIYKNLVFKSHCLSDKYEAYTLGGTPADCVKFACHYFSEKPFELVCSGINLGNNLGSDTCYSGTVSAGLEGNFFGIKSIAFSNVSHKPEKLSLNADFIDRNLDRLFCLANSAYTLNVNMPDGKENGVKIAKLGRQLYSDEYQKNEDGTFILTGYPIKHEQDEDCDVEWARKGFVTVTPISYDRTAFDAIEKLNGDKFL